MRRIVHGHACRGKISREFSSWMHMKTRCYNEKDDNYPRYGGRGIKICERWLESFENFLDDMGLQPEGLTLERIDNDGDYGPTNCRWASPKEQARNRMDTVFVKHDNKTLCLKDWAKELGISPITFYSRWYRGWGIERIASQPVIKRNYG